MGVLDWRLEKQWVGRRRTLAIAGRGAGTGAERGDTTVESFSKISA
jgi:hypothetical protein